MLPIYRHRRTSLFYSVFQKSYFSNPAFEINKRLHVPMEGRDDGTSYVDEYISLMDAGLPASVEYEIKDILLEEISYYFLGDKSEDEVARVIQSRVQLYLDEQR